MPTEHSATTQSGDRWSRLQEMAAMVVRCLGMATLIAIAVYLEGCSVDAPTTSSPSPAAPGIGDSAIRISASTPATGALQRETVNSLGMSLVLIPAGEFAMGNPEAEKEANPNTRPQHVVRITHAFRIGKYETTRGQFRKFVDATGYQTDAEKSGTGSLGYTGDEKSPFAKLPKFTWRNPGFEQTDDHPVVCISWIDAVAFCGWLSRQENATYRLPTEAEWEYACRGGTTSRWYVSDDERDLAQIANVADETLRATSTAFQYAKPWNDGHAFTASVGRYRENPLGLYDINGNAWEWCSDWYDESFYANSPAEDPQGPLQDQSFRVLRGGSWINLPGSTRSASRLWNLPDSSNATNGFRIVKTILVEENVKQLASPPVQAPHRSGNASAAAN